MMLMPFGKYGPRHPGGAVDMNDVPASYLLWLWENDCRDEAVRAYIEKNMAGIKKQIADGNGEK